MIYSGYFNALTESQNYYLNPIVDLYENNVKPLKTYIDQDKNITLAYIFFLELNLPISIYQTYNQKTNYLNSIAIIAGYMFLFYSTVKFCVTKCATFKLNESIANDTFNLIAPNMKDVLLESEKTIKDNLISKSNSYLGNEIDKKILDLSVDQFYKYHHNRGLNFNFWQLQNYLCCVSCCKNKNQIQMEKTLDRALEELYKSIDVTNVIKCSQEIKVFKEVLFEPNQRQIFDHLLRPTIIGDTVLSSYNAEMTSHLETSEELHIMTKSALKDCFVQLSKQDSYNEFESKLIDLIFIDPALKKKFFNKEEKENNFKDNYMSI